MKVFLLDLNPYSHMSYGLLCLADALGQEGHQVIVGGRPRGLAKAIRNPHELDFVAKQVKAASPDLVGLSAFSTTAFALKTFLLRLRELLPTTPLVLGGFHCILQRERALDENPLADFCFSGEGEVEFPRFLSMLSDGSGIYRDIPGLVFRENGKSFCNPAPAAADFSNYIPVRAFKKYTSPDIFAMDKPVEAPLADTEHFYPLVQPTLAVLLSRGCPYRCTFCHMPSHPYNGMRFLSPEAFRQQLTSLLDEFAFRSIFIHDSMFDINKPWAREIMRIIKDEPRIVDWACQLKPDLVKDDFVAELVDARCRAVGLYLENSVERIRNGVLNKHCSQPKLELAYEIVEKHRLFVRVNVILGSPGETSSEIAENVEFLERHPSGQVRFLRLFVLPGTELYEKYPDCRFIHNREISDEQYNNLVLTLGIHYGPFAIQLRKWIPIAGKSLLLVEDEPSGRLTLRSMQELSLMMSLPGKPADKLPSRMTFLVGPCPPTFKASLPPNSKVLEFPNHPLAFGPRDDNMYDDEMNGLRKTGYDYLLVASEFPSKETLDAAISLANQLGIVRVAVVNRRHGIVFDYDLFSKSLSQHRFSLNFAGAVVDALKNNVPMSNETTDFQLLTESCALENDSIAAESSTFVGSRRETEGFAETCGIGPDKFAARSERKLKLLQLS